LPANDEENFMKKLFLFLPNARPTSSGGGVSLTRPTRRGRSCAAILAFLALVPAAQTQYYPGIPPGYPVPPPQQPALSGPTFGANLRNAANATQTQAGIVRRGAGDWARRANAAGYSAAQLQQDFANMQFQFQALREQFNVLGNLALQLGRPRASNAVAELDSGLNTIGELFTFLQSQYSAGTLDRRTIVRTCGAFADAMRVWEQELQRNTSRLGLVW
jgi:hypothetical protein